MSSSSSSSSGQAAAESTIVEKHVEYDQLLKYVARAETLPTHLEDVYLTSSIPWPNRGKIDIGLQEHLPLLLLPPGWHKQDTSVFHPKFGRYYPHFSYIVAAFNPSAIMKRTPETTARMASIVRELLYSGKYDDFYAFLSKSNIQGMYNMYMQHFGTEPPFDVLRKKLYSEWEWDDFGTDNGYRKSMCSAARNIADRLLDMLIKTREQCTNNMYNTTTPESTMAHWTEDKRELPTIELALQIQLAKAMPRTHRMDVLMPLDDALNKMKIMQNAPWTKRQLRNLAQRAIDYMVNQAMALVLYDNIDDNEDGQCDSPPVRASNAYMKLVQRTMARQSSGGDLQQQIQDLD